MRKTRLVASCLSEDDDTSHGNIIGVDFNVAFLGGGGGFLISFKKKSIFPPPHVFF